MKRDLIVSSAPWLPALTLIIALSCSSPGGRQQNGGNETNRVGPVKYTIEIASMKFTPAILNVHIGDTVVFVNNDIVAHDVTEEKEKAWSSSPLSRGASWQMIALAPVSYYCSIHPVMKGRIIVQ